MTKQHIDSYQEGSAVTKSSKCILKGPFGKCMTKKKIKKERPRPSYYWPKYFIEVTEKGNDSHPAFARFNRLYTANRKISQALSKFMDLEGAIKLTSYVMGGKALLSQVGMKVGENDFGDLAKIAVLTPFEKMRIRANKQKSMSTFDVNIWPVASSELIATHFSVCGPVRINQGKSPGGYSWAFKGMPMTCPVAMTNDAYPYWDTGMLDYIDPESIMSMALASNPLTCGAAQGMSALGDSMQHSGNMIGEQGKITQALGSLSENLGKALKSCSWPILGTGEAIAKKALALTSLSKWKQQKCTIWGSLAPRASSSPYSNDYSYANSALKFKLLAHEMFGVPRGEQERWSLAYPWEGPGIPRFGGNFASLGQIYDRVSGQLGSFLEKLGIKLPSTDRKKSRSQALLRPGSPLLIDLSYSAKSFTDKIKNFAIEMGYLSTLFISGQAARAAMRKKLERKYGVKLPSQGDAIRRHERDLTQSEEDTAHHKQEAIWKAFSYCHKSDRRGIIHSGTKLNVGGSVLSFQKGISRQQCLSTARVRGCLRAKRAKCREPNHVTSYFFSRMEIVGYKKKKHPIHRQYSSKCKYLGRHTHRGRRSWGHRRRRVTDDEHIDRYACKSELKDRSREDTTQRIARPRASDPSSLVQNSSSAQAIIEATGAVPWVAAEVARSKYSEILGANPIPGDRRIYTIWEKISCTYPSTRITIKIGPGPEIRKYENCQSAIRFEVYKYIQTKLLRKICDLLGQTVGTPWR